MGVKRFVWDEVSDNVLLETDETDTVTARYCQFPERFGELLFQDRNGTKSFYHYDGNSSTCNLTNSSESVTDTTLYTACGEEVSSSGSTTNPFGYKGAVGYYTNDSTGDIYVRIRSYEPTIGRWLSKDPLGFVDGTSLYRAYFVPSSVDPEGLQIVQVINAIKGPYTSTQGDITGTFYIDASIAAVSNNNPDPTRYQTPPASAIGVEGIFKDAKAGQPCPEPDGCGAREWFTFKWQRKSEKWVYNGNTWDITSPFPGFPLDKFWVKDGYGGNTTTPHYDYPTRGITVTGKNDVGFLYQEFAVLIGCKCASGVLENSLSILYYSFVARQAVNSQGEQWAAIIWEDSVQGPKLPDPGWAEIWGLPTVQDCD